MHSLNQSKNSFKIWYFLKKTNNINFIYKGKTIYVFMYIVFIFNFGFNLKLRLQSL